MKRDDKVYVRHALDAARKIREFTDHVDRTTFDRDEKLALAVIRLLEVIGEAANSLSQEFRDYNQIIPWGKMIAMRNRLIHGYFDVNYDIVWHTVKNDIPVVIHLLEEIS
jgi:uncharacterized protein with HEPN domain